MGRFFEANGKKMAFLGGTVFEKKQSEEKRRNESIFATGLLIAYVNPINRIRCSERVFAFQITHSVFVILKYEFRIF